MSGLLKNHRGETNDLFFFLAQIEPKKQIVSRFNYSKYSTNEQLNGTKDTKSSL